MAERVDRLKKLLAEQKKEETKEAPKEKEAEIPTVETIVERMREKYIKEGVKKEEMAPVAERAEALKEILEKGPAAPGAARGAGGAASQLPMFPSPVVKALGRFYLALESPLSGVSRMIANTQIAQTLRLNLESANMGYSLEQYLALSISAAGLIGILAAVIAAMLVFSGMSAALAVAMVILAPAVAFFVALVIPSGKATSRARNIEKELPYALRHLATEIKAGVGVHKALESISKADYGPLSEDFAKVLFDIEKGTTTEDALEKEMERTRSEGLKRALMNLIRAIRTGGALSEIIGKIAEDVSFELRMRIRDFVEKLNVIGLFFMMVAIVLPVFVAIIAGIGASQPSLPMSFIDTTILVMIYAVSTSLLALILFIIKSIQP